MMRTMKLNGRDVAFKAGQTILEAAANAGVENPTLCFVKDALPHGACRICVVEVAGSDELVPACATPAAEGIEVQTDSERVHATRRGILDLLASSTENGWQFNARACDGGSAANARLRALCEAYGVTSSELPTDRSFPLDEEHHLIRRDFSRCIQCGRCIAACNEVQVTGAIPYPYGRQEERSHAPTGWYPVADYDKCVYCGECVQACPTGALQDKKACAIDPDKPLNTVRTTCSYCGVGCQVHLHVQDDRVVKVTGVEDAIPNRGRLCVKGRFGYDFIHSDDRLTTPLIKENGSFREAGWDEALDLVARRFSEIKDQHGGDSMACLTSARVSNEENYLMQKLARGGFGTNNIDHCARL